MNSIRVAVVCSVALLAGAAHTVMAAPATHDALRRDLVRLAAESGGRVGVAIRDLDSGETIAVDGDVPFTMMSVFKLPIALTVLHLVDQGPASLDEPLRVRRADLRPGVSAIAAAFHHDIDMTIAELLRAMLVESDNSACDLLLRRVGGPAAVQRRMRDLGITGIDVTLSELEMWQEYMGVRSLGPPQRWSPPDFERLAGSVPARTRRAAADRFARDSRNTAEPVALVTLLDKVTRGETLTARSTAWLLDVLAQTTAAPNRLKGLLPADVIVRHRPGTSATTDGITAATNDIGIIELPAHRGRLAIAVLISGSRADLAAREHTIAAIARVVYDEWMNVSPGTPLQYVLHD